MRKTLAIAAVLLGLTCPAQAANEITTGAGDKNAPVMVENNSVIIGDAQFDFVKYNPGIPKNLCRSFYGMASLIEDTGKYANGVSKAAGDYVEFTNNGTIRMSFKDIAGKWATDLDSDGDSSRKYDALMGWGMFAGEYSRLVNNGDILVSYDGLNKNSSNALLYHAMHACDHSAIINNGNVIVTGAGSSGSEVHGITTAHGDMRLENNGLIRLDVAEAFMARGFLAMGDGGSVINNGEIYNRGCSSVFGMLATSGTDLINNGQVTVISSGHRAGKMAGGHPPFAVKACGAYGMTSSPKSSGGDGSIVNRGKLVVKVVSDKNSNPEAVAAGMLVMNARIDPTPLTLENTGIIEVSSNIKPCAENGYMPRVSEISISSLLPEWKNTNVAIGEWATTLRDFGAKKDFIQARNCSIDFSKAKLILRGEVGKYYRIAPETLIAPIGANSLAEANIIVTGFDQLTFTAENPDEYAAQVKKNSDGSYDVALRKRGAR